MISELNKITGNKLLNISHPSDSIWTFNFDGELIITLECPWRLLNSNSITLAGNDHNQKFGKDIPVNVISETKALLNGNPIMRFTVTESPADLRIDFENNIVLEAFCDSSGYEPWQMTYCGKNYVIIGGGEISCY